MRTDDAPSLSKRGFLGLIGATCLGATGLGGAAAALPRGRQDGPTTAAAGSFPRTLLLVRHAERADEPGEDPPLSDAGQARAKRLAAALAGAGVTHLFATEFVRTQRTLQPLAERTHLEVRPIPARRAAALLQALSSLPQGAVAVVAGHSNTVPPLLAKLCPSAAAVTIADDEYDRLFVVTQWGPGQQALALPLRY